MLYAIFIEIIFFIEIFQEKWSRNRSIPGIIVRICNMNESIIVSINDLFIKYIYNITFYPDSSKSGINLSYYFKIMNSYHCVLSNDYWVFETILFITNISWTFFHFSFERSFIDNNVVTNYDVHVIFAKSKLSICSLICGTFKSLKDNATSSSFVKVFLNLASITDFPYDSRNWEINSFEKIWSK